MKKINGAAGFVLRSASLAGIVALASNTVLADGLPDLKGESYGPEPISARIWAEGGAVTT
jgi:hypothetical protein